MIDPEFMEFIGVDGRGRAVAKKDVRLLEDLAEKGGVTVTLCDGTQFDAAGSVESILLTQRSI